MLQHSIPIENFIPNFFLVAPHGVGTLSFIYYLTNIGLLASLEAPYCYSEYMNGQISKLSFPVNKTEKINGRGFTYSNIITNFKLLKFDTPEAKVIQVIRDPIDQLTSLINFFIANCANGYGRNFTVLNRKLHIEFIKNFITWSCMYRSLFNCVNNYREIFYIDTQEIIGKNCIHTIKRVADFFDINDFNDKDSIYNTSYNSFENRLWLYQSYKSLCLFPSTCIQGIKIIPSYLYDYGANHLEKSYILDEFSYLGENYTIWMPYNTYLSIDKNKNNFFDIEKRDAIKTVIDIFLEHKKVSERYYNKYKISWQDTISTIKSNNKFYTRFMKLMDYELHIVKNDAPQKVETWHHFNSL